MSLAIGPHRLASRVLLAPMAGVTDPPFRSLCHRFGAALCGAEMLTSDQDLWHSAKSRRRMDHRLESGIRTVQLAGADPARLAAAARLNVDLGAQIIDINLGCPAKKVCDRLCGSALLSDEVLVGRIFDTVVAAVDVPVTAKIRTGPDPASRNALRIAGLAQQSGIAAIAIHGRTRSERFAGHAEYDTIRNVKQHVHIPVIANGDISTPAQARAVLEHTGADAVMIGRAAQGAPWIFHAVNEFMADEKKSIATKNKFIAPHLQDDCAPIILSHLESLYNFYGEHSGIRMARKHLGWYCQRLSLPAQARPELMVAHHVALSDPKSSHFQHRSRIFEIVGTATVAHASVVLTLLGIREEPGGLSPHLFLVASLSRRGQSACAASRASAFALPRAPRKPMSESRASEAQSTQVLPILPLRSSVLFPGVVLPFDVGRPKTVALAEMLAGKKEALVAVFAQKVAEVDDPTASDLHDVGVVARVVGAIRQEEGRYALVLQGLERIRLDAVVSNEPYLVGRVSKFEETDANDAELEALGMSLRDTTREVLKHLPQLPREIVAQVESLGSTSALADFVAGHFDAKIEDKVRILATPSAKERVREVLKLVAHRLETLKMRDRINTHVKDEMGKTQREHVLRQQLKAIQEELNGGEDEGEGDLDDLAKRIAEAELSEEAAEVAKKQLKRLRTMQSASPEYTMVRTYLDWILDVPWKKQTDDKTDIAAVRAVLDADHYGLEKVKKRILEFLAVRKLKTDKKGPILCLIGPPGVGKTSLAKSVASALGKKLHRISLGGVHDEAAIRGHRRTYIGALPGQIIQGMKKVGTTNPVFVMDEVDKLGHDYRGDPSSALLEVLDPEQNNTFADHYLEIPYDLSNVMFIATANVGDTIPGPLRDRMEIIEIPGYTRREKLAIARRHLFAKQVAEHGLTPEQLDISDAALETVIHKYTREAGVRSLEKKLAAIVRGVVVKIAETPNARTSITTEDDIREFLGPAPFSDEMAERTEDAGVATGLAWTSVGGEILFIEATKMPGHGKLLLTGQLGDVMKESAQAALSYVRANADRYGIAKEIFEKSDLHVHIPAGGMPKDGPSAGVTLFSALVSLLTGIRVRHDVAMTGEITLRGRVLPIGGLKEKVLAAHRAGIKRVIVPDRNRFSLDEVPDEVKKELEFVFVSRMEQVIDAALEQVPVPTVSSVNVIGGIPSGSASAAA